MRILLVTQWFDPEPTAKGALFARKLADRGHKVTVITGFPNYPTGRLYPGYKIRPCQRTQDGPVRVLRVPLYPSHDTSVLRRILNYVSFAASSALAVLVVPRVDVAYIYHPPGTLGLPAFALRFLRNIPFIYDVQDLWPESLAATQMVRNARLLKAVDIWMGLIYRAAALVVVQSPGFAGRLERGGVPRRKLRLIYNWTFELTDSNIKTISPAPAAFDNTAQHIVYAGNIGAAQQLDVIIHAAEALNKKGADVKFHIVGDGVDLARLKDMAAQHGLRNVTFHGRKPPAEMPAILSAADALLIHLRDDPLFSITIPSKTQASLLAAKPILMAVRGDAAALVHEARAGFIIEPGDAEQLAGAVTRMAALPPSEREEMGKRGKSFYDAHLSPEVGVAKFAEVLRDAQRLHEKTRPRPRLRLAGLLSAAVLVRLAATRRGRLEL